MKLSQLLIGITDTVTFDCDVIDITNDSRKVQPGFCYVAIAGFAADGHDYAKKALEQGAVAVIVEKDLGLDRQILVSDTKQAYAVICANFFDGAVHKMKLVGVTGTNGKTSITTMIRHILVEKGLKVGLIGTINIEYGDVVKKNPNTTPDAYLLHQTFAEMLEAGCQYVVMEASSHALAQERLYGCTFEVCAFTNLTQDHLDYHTDMEDYFAAKCKLFAMGEKQVLNLRDPYGKRLAEQYADAITFSVEDADATLYAHDIVCTPADVVFLLNHNDVVSKVHFAIPGLYSVENALTAIGVCQALGLCMHDIISALEQIKGISGRCEVVYRDAKMTVIRDYAHSPDGIVNVLSSAKEYVGGRLVAVFGCGGDRDRTKRPKMAAAAGAYADFVIVTSDNPRSENPDAIIEEIIPGLPAGVDYAVIADRHDAIAYAMKQAKQDDTIMLLGKGHEDYQILNTGTIHFDEKEVVQEIAKSLH